MISLILPIRIAQAVLSIIVLGMAAYVASVFNSSWLTSSPSSLNFTIFCCVWTWFALAYLMLVPQFLPRLHHKWAVLGVEGVTNIFWFCAWIAWSAYLGPRHFRCSSNGPCGSAVATAVFSVFIWLLFCGSLFLVGRQIWIQRADEPKGTSDAPYLPPGGEGATAMAATSAPSSTVGSVGANYHTPNDIEGGQYNGFNPSETPKPYEGNSPYATNEYQGYNGNGNGDGNVTNLPPTYQSGRDYTPAMMPSAGGWGGRETTYGDR